MLSSCPLVGERHGKDNVSLDASVMDQCLPRPTGHLTHDVCRNLVDTVFQTNTKLEQINTKCVQIESPNSTNYVKRYHTPINYAYTIVTSNDFELDVDAAMLIVVKSLNDSTGLDGLVPALLVYGALPHFGLTTNNTTLSTYQRAVSLCKTTEAVSNHFAKTEVSSAVRKRNGPDTSEIFSASIGTPVRLYIT